MTTTHSLLIPFLLTVIAGSATSIGSLLFLFIKKIKKVHLIFSLGLSAGAMFYISFVELLRIAIKDIGFVPANLSFFFGILAMLGLDKLLPHTYFEERNVKKGKVIRTSVLLFMGITIHNIPEGFAVFLSGYTNLKLGMVLALAILIHNIPEGIAVAAPVYFATKSKTKAFCYATLSGLAEPVGALICLALLDRVINTNVVPYLFSIVAGIMVFISFDELLPNAFSDKYHMVAVYGIILGLGIMALSLGF